jgi:hypothetical protein
MPKEDRRIIFENDEVYKAIFALSAQKEIAKPPPGVLTSVTLTETQPAEVVVRLENPAQNFNENVKYTYDFVAAALMMYCRGLGIPLPKKAHKSLLIVEGKLVLRVQI